MGILGDVEESHYGDVAVELPAILESTITTLHTTLKQRERELQQEARKADEIQRNTAELVGDHSQQIKNKERLQTEQTKVTTEFNTVYEQELQQRVELIKEEINKLQNTEEPIYKVLQTLSRKIRLANSFCNDLSEYLKYILEGLEAIEQLQEEGQEQLINSKLENFRKKFSSDLQNPIDALKASNLLNDLLAALTTLQTIFAEMDELKQILKLGAFMKKELAKMRPILGMSVMEIFKMCTNITNRR